MEIHEHGALALLQAMQAGRLGSTEIVQALHARADRCNPRVNAFVAQYREQALAQARAADEARARGERLGPLHGLPITIKENIEIAGTEATLGARARAGRVSTTDALVVQALKAAGAIILGKTNVPQLLVSMETENALYGITGNPWDPARSAGGSSGGEAAAVASGMSPLGLGTDLAGSVRGPATWCGIAGLKPTLHRISNLGSLGALLGQEFIRAQVGPLARRVEDLVLVMDVLRPEAFAARDPEVPPIAVRSPADVDLRGMRIGFHEDDGYFTPSPSVMRAVREAARALEARGATVVAYPPPEAHRHYPLVSAALTADGLQTMRRVLDGENPVRQMVPNMKLGQLPRSVLQTMARAARAAGQHRLGDIVEGMGRKDVSEWWELSFARTTLQRRELAAWNDKGLDALICPASVTPAAPIGSTGDFTAAACYTARYNLLNLPAGVVPWTRVRDDDQVRRDHRDRLDGKAASIDEGATGLPIGVQVVGRPWREDVVLAVMAALEAEARRGPDAPVTPVTPN